jgi:hypothetical protein
MEFDLQFFDADKTNGLMPVTGAGSDTVGVYNMTGKFNSANGRLALDKTYIKGTGNVQENLGHTVKLMLTWENGKRWFDGAYFVLTWKYIGSDKWTMSLKS